MEKNDASLIAFKSRFTAQYGAGTIPWTQLLAALMSLLTGCVLPTPANIKSQIKRPLVHVRLFLRLQTAGVSARDSLRSIAATEATLDAATDDEVAGYIAAAQEAE